MKQRKIMQITDGINIECIERIQTSGEREYNPYRVYLLYHGRDKYGFPSVHRKQIAKYGDFFSVICFIHDLYRSGVNGWTVDDIFEWCDSYHSSICPVDK